jgi:3-deoxy-manno-octulosonate cytidylyltransferase (CMP-KDO synthetase)
MKTAIIIPARFASTRYPGKPLVEIRLPNGQKKTLIELSWLAAKRVANIQEVYVATDDTRIRDAAIAFGADVIMTDENCSNGTERCADAVAKAGIDADLIVNLQGDAPLTPHWFVEDLISEMKLNPNVDMATPVLRLNKSTYELLVKDRKEGRAGGVTAVFDNNMFALYFSREVLPSIKASNTLTQDPIEAYHHVGVYAYSPKSLAKYAAWTESTLEQIEGLEQLRFLENGGTIKCVKVESRGRVCWELNNPEDILHIEKAIGEIE